MRRTLTVLVTTAAFVLPAAAANASVHEGEVRGPGTNASCNNGTGGNYVWTDMSYNGKGKVGPVAGECAAPTAPDLVPVDTTNTPPVVSL